MKNSNVPKNIKYNSVPYLFQDIERYIHNPKYESSYHNLDFVQAKQLKSKKKKKKDKLIFTVCCSCG